MIRSIRLRTVSSMRQLLISSRTDSSACFHVLAMTLRSAAIFPHFRASPMLALTIATMEAGSIAVSQIHTIGDKREKGWSSIRFDGIDVQRRKETEISSVTLGVARLS